MCRHALFLLPMFALLLSLGGRAATAQENDTARAAIRHMAWSYEQGLAQLDELGAPAVAALIQTIDSDEDWTIRVRALSALAELGPKYPEEARPAIPLLLSIIEEEDGRLSAVAALGALGKNHPDIYMRIIQTLASETEWGLEVYRQALKDSRPVPPNAVDLLVTYLSHAHPAVRSIAYDILLDLGADARDGAPLVDTMLQRGYPPEDLGMGALLISMSGEEALRTINIRISADKLLAEDIRALAALGAPGAQMLMNKMKTESWTIGRRVAAGGPMVLPALISASTNEEYYVRRNALVAIGYLQSTAPEPPLDLAAALNPLTQALQGKDKTLQAIAAQSLAELGATEAYPALEQARDTASDPALRRVFNDALFAMGVVTGNTLSTDLPLFTVYKTEVDADAEGHQQFEHWLQVEGGDNRILLGKSYLPLQSTYMLSQVDTPSITVEWVTPDLILDVRWTERGAGNSIRYSQLLIKQGDAWQPILRANENDWRQKIEFAVNPGRNELRLRMREQVLDKLDVPAPLSRPQPWNQAEFGRSFTWLREWPCTVDENGIHIAQGTRTILLSQEVGIAELSAFLADDTGSTVNDMTNQLRELNPRLRYPERCFGPILVSIAEPPFSPSDASEGAGHEQ